MSIRRRERHRAHRDASHLLVVHTMSKSRALAGLRIGYAIGDAGLIDALNRVKNSFNSYPLGRPAQAGAIASLEDEDFFQQSRAAVMEYRARLNAALPVSSSRCCRRRPVSCSRATVARAARRWRRR
jgi:histidinol-phosphate/aromatic aminotransferase/cobyric acid decarboxylase-like protein